MFRHDNCIIHVLFRRAKVLEELLSTEERYVQDLHTVLVGYGDRLESASNFGFKTEDMFGNMEEIFEFHSQYLLPELGRCGENSRMIAKTSLEYSDDMKRIYCR